MPHLQQPEPLTEDPTESKDPSIIINPEKPIISD